MDSGSTVLGSRLLVLAEKLDFAVLPSTRQATHNIFFAGQLRSCVHVIAVRYTA